MNDKGQMQLREEHVVFGKDVKCREKGDDGTETVTRRTIEHEARIVTYVDEKKHN